LSQSNGGDGILLGVNGGSSPSIGGAETDIYAWYHFDLQTDPNWNPGQKYTYLNLTVKNNTSTIKTIYASWELTSSLPVGKQQGFVQFPNYPIVWYDLPYTGNGVQITIINPGQSWTFTTKIDAKADAGRNVPYTNDHRLHLAVYPGSSGVSTPTPTPTATFTPTSTSTNTPTFTPTNTFIPATPHNNGSGTCWSSQESWDAYMVYYDILTSPIPGNITEADWVASIEAAAQTWTNVTPSNFTFVRQIGASNTVRLEVPNDESKLAASAPAPSSGFITSGYTKINPNYLWDVNNTPIPGNPGNNGSTITYNIQNVVTHELGHWLYLNDINDSNCRDVTMDYSSGHGELIKIDLDIADENAVNWQYP